MHGREGENRKRNRHMWSVPTRGTTVTRTVAGDLVASTADSFSKDGRKISVGDCALFKPVQDSPPFIGIIRSLTLNKENTLQLGVNWLYRPAELKLGKGILLDAAPNEVFYSFHKDEIPAASLLHPCKVAFLPQGVELPPGVSSFVCHRVYDIANKCLWWLTDQDYIDERQEEVDQLLHKTQRDMHGTVQSGGRSPKPVNSPTSTSQLKLSSDNVQSAASFPSQVKGKKRERADQGSESVKRERSSRTDDGDSGLFKPEGILKIEISKITDKGGLVDSEGAEKLVQLMQADRAERKMELISRSMLAGVVAATEKFDCLSLFVQFKGLVVLDQWLQDVHKGKIGDGSPKDGDKSVEEFLFVLLRALDKLPVNLHALQMCNIGKSVNHLRSHKNLEIQKKARSLVDTWKKRVEAEMNVIDAKSGSGQAVSWNSRSRLPEASHGGSRYPGGAAEVAMKSSLTQLSASKTASGRGVQGEITVKSASSPPGQMKSVLSPASGKDGQPTAEFGGNLDHPSTTAREERSSSSSQSHNSQSYSSDHAKTTVFSGKEDVRSPVAGSMNVNKMSGTSRHRRSVNGFAGIAATGGQKETGSSRSSSLHKNPASEKLSESGLTSEKAFDEPIVEGTNHKLIVKIPNGGRSPAQSATGGSLEDPSIVNSRASSPVLSEKHDRSVLNAKDRADANRANTSSDVNTESWQSNDFKDVLTGSDEGDGSPDTNPEEQQHRSADEATNVAEMPGGAPSSSGNELKSGKLLEASLSSINALIESCVKHSKEKASMLAGDDVGMNLLASVAAGEMSKSDFISPTDSPQRNTPTVEDCCTGDYAKSKLSRGNVLALEQRSTEVGAIDDMKQGAISGSSLSRDRLHHLSDRASGGFSGDGKTISRIPEQAPTPENNEYNSSNLDSQLSSEPCPVTNERVGEVGGISSLTVSLASAAEKVLGGRESKKVYETIVAVASVDGNQDTKPTGTGCLLTGEKVNEVLSSVEVEKAVVSGPSLEIDGEYKNNVNEGCNGSDHGGPMTLEGKVHSEHLERSNKELLNYSGCGKVLPSDGVNGLNSAKLDDVDRSHHSMSGVVENDHRINCTPANEHQVLVNLGSGVCNQKSDGMDANVESKEVLERTSSRVRPAFPAPEAEHHVTLRGSKMTGFGAEDAEESESSAKASSSPAGQATIMDTRLEFDLNEGLIADDTKYGEAINTAGPGCSASSHLVNLLPFPVSSVSGGLPPSITVASAAKGPFVPPEDLLRSKGELGWKGSAATSAFRPAEPRKALDMPLGTTSTPLSDATVSKHGRPLLDFDLNVPDDRILEDMASQKSTQDTASTSGHRSHHGLAHNDLMGSAPIRNTGGLDLDLNQVDEASDIGQFSKSGSCRLEASLLPVKLSPPGGFSNGEARRDFDLNNGPVLDEGSAEPSSFSLLGRSSMPSQPPVAGLRMNNSEIANFSSWLTAGNTYPAVTIPSILSDRGEQPFPVVATGVPPRMLGPTAGGNPFTDVYRGAVLSSSPAVPFPSAPFQYPVFPFGATFPLPAATFSGGSTTYTDPSSAAKLCFPHVNSQLLGPAATLSSSQYPRPYVPESSHSIGVDNIRKWGRQGLDLNAGPGSLDIEGRDETSPLPSRQLFTNSQALAEEQARMSQQVAGSFFKRKEPEGGWENESIRYKQSSWQ